ncbi:E3 SUMO-protein ligase KIAA1586-like [Lineus longissimus]|uniref:E3 SUMO-protein ligase KIAA1586-like n=1 Tax=Lineus longissimus TaxID=88925 RepID=UPI00315CD16A
MSKLTDYFGRKNPVSKKDDCIVVPEANLEKNPVNNRDVEIITATVSASPKPNKQSSSTISTPNSKKTKPKPAVSSSTKKRTLKSSTVDRWIKSDLARDNAELWLKYTADRDGNVSALRCTLCTSFEDELKTMKDFSPAWINGSGNLKLSNPKDHANTLCHAKAYRLHCYKVRRETGADCVVTLPEKLVDPKQQTIPDACERLSTRDEEQLTKKFEVAYMVAKKELPFTTYEDIVKLEMRHGVDVGTAYTNRFQCAEFIDCHAEYLAETLKNDLVKAKFYSVLCDGSTDCTITEKEVVYVLYFDPVGDPDKVQVKLTFLYLKDVGVPNAPGIQSAIERSFQSLGILPCEMYRKLVGFGADGASVNSGDKAGVKALLSKHAPWLVFQWCVAHRLELALKDALKDTYFKKVDHMLMRLFYLYHKAPKKLFELKALYEVMKNTFEFEEGTLKPKRACGTRWISFKLDALKLVLDKFGVYMAHLKKLSPKVAEIAGYLRKWNTPHMLIQVAFYIDVLTPVATLSKIYQGEGVDVVRAGEALGKTKVKLGKLKKKKLEEMSTMKICLQKVEHINEKAVYQGLEFSHAKFDHSLNVMRGQKTDILDVVESCVSSRLDAGSDPLIEQVAMVLNCESWLARSEVDDDDECFADDEITALFQHFCFAHQMLQAGGKMY